MSETRGKLGPVRVVRLKLSEQIADTLEQLIINEEMEDQQKMMPEQELADQFQVSKTVIREALNILKERGLIETRNGMGNYITKPKVQNLSDVINRMIQVKNIGYKEIYEARTALETTACYSAAEHISDKTLKKLEEQMLQLEREDLSIEERRNLDLDFHSTIAQASGNNLIEILILAIRNICYATMFLEHDIENEESIRKSIYHHRRIYDCLSKHQPAEAEEAMRKHLTDSVRNVERVLAQDAK